MSSNIDQHHVLSLTDSLHEKYQFTDGEYKELVEALGGKKKPIDVSTATVVKITFDEHRVTWEGKSYTLRPNRSALLRVADELEDTGEVDPFVYHWANNNIERHVLEEIAELVAENGETYRLTQKCECCADERILVKEVEVLK